MFKKSVIIGLLLLLTGAGGLLWKLSEQRKEQESIRQYQSNDNSSLNEYLRQYEQWLQSSTSTKNPLPWELDENGKLKTAQQIEKEKQQRLKTDIIKLAADDEKIYPFANLLYPDNWQQELREYKDRKESREFILNASAVLTVVGIITCTWCLLLGIARLIIKAICGTKQLIQSCWYRFKIAQKIKASAKLELLAKAGELIPIDTEKVKKTLSRSGWKNPHTESEENDKHTADKQDIVPEQKPPAEEIKAKAEEIAVILSGEKLLDVQKQPETENEIDTSNNISPPTEPKDIKPADQPQDESDEPQQTQPLNQDENEQPDQITHAIQKSLTETEPINNTLKELTEQIAAIREYASNQQNRVEKLQDGYDWNIIRNFCIRVIRCIDNLDIRIKQMAEDEIDTSNLEEVRDELLFALESSGVEQFIPKRKSDYSGQERLAEVIKEKQFTDDPEKAGKIAEVIRPGYQYHIDDTNVKIVRTAQVKLFAAGKPHKVVQGDKNV